MYCFCSQVIRLNSLIDAGDLEGVSDLLSHNVGLNPEKGVYLNIKHIPLFHAVHTGDCRVVEMLIKAGADPNIRGKRSIRRFKEYLHILVYAARQAANGKSYSAFEMLLQYGADPYDTTASTCSLTDNFKEGKSLYDIMPLSDWILSRILLENGAHPDKRDRQGKTLLYKGCRHLDKPVVHLLLLFNAYLEIPCQVGTHIGGRGHFTPFQYMSNVCTSWVDVPSIKLNVEAIDIAHSLVKAGAAVYKDCNAEKSITTLFQDWAYIENTMQQPIWMLTDEERQVLTDGIKLIKHRLTHPGMLKYLCGYKIRRILRPPDFQRKLTRLSQEFHLPQRLIDDYIAMRDMFPLGESESGWVTHIQSVERIDDTNNWGLIFAGSS